MRNTGVFIFCTHLFEDESANKFTYNTKELHRLACKYNVELKSVKGDLMLSAYLLRPSDSNYDISHLCLEYGVKIPEYLNSLGNRDEIVELSSVIKPLFEKTDKLIDEASERNLLEEIELPLSRVLAKWNMSALKLIKTELKLSAKCLVKE